MLFSTDLILAVSLSLIFIASFLAAGASARKVAEQQARKRLVPIRVRANESRRFN
jgi:positive regulator of sigma E activity